MSGVVRCEASAPHSPRTTTPRRHTDSTPARTAVFRLARRRARAKIPAARASIPTVQTWASRVAAKARPAAVVAATRGQVARRDVQMKPAKTRARRLMERDSESSDRFHRVTGRVLANPRITKMAVTRRQPGSTSRPTVQASTPQAHRAHDRLGGDQ